MHEIYLTPLGTSAAAPTALRNVSASLLRMDGHTVLLDCGEGTQHRLQQAEWRPGALDAILISHLHGDHVYGLPGLLATLGMQGRSRALTVCGPPGIRRYLEAVFSASYFASPFPMEIVEADRGEVYRGDGYRVETAPLIHRVPASGFAVIEDDRRGRFDPVAAKELGVPEGPLFTRLQSGEAVKVEGRVVRSEQVVEGARKGRRVVYCCDTIPCAAAIELAREADLLMHESTYGDELEHEAAARGHSTARQAAEVALAAGVKLLVLTHISARYEEPDALLQQARSVFPTTILARELEPIRV